MDVTTRMYALENRQNMMGTLFGSVATTSGASSILSAVQSSRTTAQLIKIYGNDADSPYGQNTAQTKTSPTGATAYDIKEMASELSELAKNLSSGAAFNTPKAVSSDSEAVSVSGGKVGAAEVTLDVRRLAVAQENQGAALASKDYIASAGYKRFSLEVDGKATEFTVSFNGGEDALATQRKMADAINQKTGATGVRATVEVDALTGASSLSLESVNTGTKSAFSVQDGNGGLVQAMGIGQATTEAQNAVYRVGSSEFTSQSNTVQLSNGVTATFNEPTGQPVNISVVNDKSGGLTDVRKFVASFNDLVENGNSKLQNDMARLVRTNAAALSRVGIYAESDGTLSIDSEKLEKAAEDGTLERSMARVSGFAGRVEGLANTVARSPNTYTLEASAGGGLYGNWSTNANYASVLFDSMM